MNMHRSGVLTTILRGEALSDARAQVILRVVFLVNFARAGVLLTVKKYL
jgi:hypothetical protein